MPNESTNFQVSGTEPVGPRHATEVPEIDNTVEELDPEGFKQEETPVENPNPLTEVSGSEISSAGGVPENADTPQPTVENTDQPQQ